MSFSPNTDDALVAGWRRREAAYGVLVKAQNPVNKATILSALAQLGIETVTVNFDGSGDEGRIESVVAEARGETVDLPAAIVEMLGVDFQSLEPERVQQGLDQAVLDFAEELLDQTHRYWGDGDGAYGEVVFDVAGDEITIDFNARFTASENFTHTF